MAERVDRSSEDSAELRGELTRSQAEARRLRRFGPALSRLRFRRPRA